MLCVAPLCYPLMLSSKMAISFLGLLGLMFSLDNFLCHHDESFLCIAVRQNAERFARLCSVGLSQFAGSFDAFGLGNYATSLSSNINRTAFLVCCESRD